MTIDGLRGLVNTLPIYIRDTITNEPKLVTGIVLEIIDNKPAISLTTE